MEKTFITGRRVISAITAALITLAACFFAYKTDIPNPAMVLVSLMIFFTALVNNSAGAASGVCAVGYSLFFFSEGHDFIHFTDENKYRLLIIIISFIIIYIMVSMIRRREVEALDRLRKLNEGLETRNEMLQNESAHDALTGIYNRRGGDRKVAECMETADIKEAVLAAVDIDNFKNINDSYGHAAGDQALLYLVSCLEKEFPDHSVLIRNGGDEFQLFLYGRETAEMEEQIRRLAGETYQFEFQKDEIAFEISCGYVFYPAQADVQKDLYRKADVALYAAKVRGRHRAALYNERMLEKGRSRSLFSVKNLSENLPVAFFVYHAGQTEEFVLVSNTLLRMCGCRDFEDFMEFYGGTFRGFVHPDDLERVEKSIEDQIRVNPRRLDAVSYRIRTRDGKILHIRDIGRMVQDPEEGDLFYVIVYDEETLSVERQAESEEEVDQLQALIQEEMKK